MWVQDVPVRVERVPCIPHGGKVLVDKPPNGDECVIWVRDDLDDQDAAQLITRCLNAHLPVRGLLHLELHAS